MKGILPVVLLFAALFSPQGESGAAPTIYPALNKCEPAVIKAFRLDSTLRYDIRKFRLIFPFLFTPVTTQDIHRARTISIYALSNMSAIHARRIMPALMVVEDIAVERYTNTGTFMPFEYEVAHIKRKLAQDTIFRKETLPWLKRMSIYYGRRY